eukprot:10735401-Prorocentrum_lima.AAC.1
MSNYLLNPWKGLKFIGVMITWAKKGDPEFPEGSYYVGQGAYTWEVWGRLSSSVTTREEQYQGSQNPSPNKSKTKKNNKNKEDILKPVQNVKANMVMLV